MPSMVVPSKKVTVPAGVVDPEAGVTVAVKLMLVPATPLVADDVSEVVVAMAVVAVTVRATGVEKLPE